MKTENKVQESGNPSNGPVESIKDSKDSAPVEGEFKMTVRKLKVPVRPRGVLAE